MSESAGLKALGEISKEEWSVKDGKLVSPSFPSGAVGTVLVYERSLIGKSDDLFRSHGFFIRVRGRLINESDEIFGLPPLSHQVFNRFRADVDIDDLDAVITAPREGIEESNLSKPLSSLLKSLFYEAREKYEAALSEAGKENRRANEDARNFVSPELVEYPIADVLSTYRDELPRVEADDSAFFIAVPSSANLGEIIRSLYEDPRAKYSFRYEPTGPTGRLVKLDPSNKTFTLNDDHEFVRAHSDNPRSRVLLEDIAIADVMLEVYLREAHVAPQVTGEVLQRRDGLLRSLAQDHPFSLVGIAGALRDSANDERDLEFALIASARALGFVATHLSNSGAADGVARLIDYPSGEKKIILEAKSSGSVPSLGGIDFAGLHDHMKQQEAHGCLLVAPAYPGSTLGEDSAAAQRAKNLKISCWTVENLARLVAAAEKRHLNARHVLDIVLNQFSPNEVSAALEQLFAEPGWDNASLYREIITRCGSWRTGCRMP